MDLIRYLADLEQRPNVHLARLLILISQFANDKGSRRIDGLTKLAKLDFLLRYPVMLERALIAKGKSTTSVKVEDHERVSVESEMVRYRFGPWDHRYRQLLNILVARGLAQVSLEGSTICIELKEKGLSVAREIAGLPEFADIARRAALVHSSFDQKGTHLMRFIYETFPELSSLQPNEAIGL